MDVSHVSLKGQDGGETWVFLVLGRFFTRNIWIILNVKFDCS
jgi:hypothetical protein